MDWEEFLERYLVNHEEFNFKYKQYIIELLYSPNGEDSAYYISEDISNKSFRYRYAHRKEYIKMEIFKTPQELLDKFIFDNLSFQDIWDKLER